MVLKGRPSYFLNFSERSFKISCLLKNVLKVSTKGTTNVSTRLKNNKLPN